jgi:GMP synthase-like glutamine amidotransferase
MSSTPAGLILQHGPTGPAGVLADWLRVRGLPFEVHRTWEEPLPGDPRSFSFVASLGSEQSLAGRGADGPAWIGEEVAFLRRTLDAGLPVLGLCFGGQALATALGAEVQRAVRPEVGWLEIDSDDPDAVPSGPWLHWHWDAFAVPEGAIELARTPIGPSAFVAGPHLGVQFHPEVTLEIVDAWAQADPESLAEAGTTPEALVAEGRPVHERAAAQAHALFDAWWARRG